MEIGISGCFDKPCDVCGEMTNDFLLLAVWGMGGIPYRRVEKVIVCCKSCCERYYPDGEEQENE